MAMPLIVTQPMGASAADGEAAPSDDILLMRIATGDRLAMRALFARHRVAVYRWLLRIAGNPASAEDLTSEVFLEVWRNAASFERRSSVSTWLLAIARYKALSALRRRGDEALDDQAPIEIPDGADDPEIALQKKDDAERMREALTALPSNHRQVIDLVYYHGKTVKEVGEVLGIPAATVKTRMFYARRRLAQELTAQAA
jgi:RNA polymerase sigma-70 factor (ECF subfamily)